MNENTVVCRLYVCLAPKLPWLRKPVAREENQHPRENQPSTLRHKTQTRVKLCFSTRDSGIGRMVNTRPRENPATAQQLTGRQYWARHKHTSWHSGNQSKIWGSWRQKVSKLFYHVSENREKMREKYNNTGGLLLLLSRFSCVRLCATPQTAVH